MNKKTFFLLKIIGLYTVNASAMSFDSAIEECNLLGGDYSYLAGCECPEGSTYVPAMPLSKENTCRPLSILDTNQYCDSSNLECLLQSDFNFQTLLVGRSLTVKFSTTNEFSTFKRSVEEPLTPETDTPSAPSAIKFWHPASGNFDSETTIIWQNNAGYFDDNPYTHSLIDLGLENTFLKQNHIVEGQAIPSHSNGSINFFSKNIDATLYMAGLTDEFVDIDFLEQSIPKISLENRYQELAFSVFNNKLIAQIKSEAILKNWSESIEQGDDCKDVCELTRSLGTVNFLGNQYSVNFVQQSLKGFLHRKFLIVSGENKQFDMLIQLTPNFYPSIIVTRAHFEENGDIKSQIKIFDKDGVKLREYKETLLTSSYLEFAKNTPQPNNLSANPNLLVCEGHTGDKIHQANDVNGSIIQGNENSLFGWVRTDSNDIYSFMEPYTNDLLGYEVPTSFSGGKHFTLVSRAALDVTPNLSILPVGSLNCTETPESWIHNASDENINVVSISQLILQKKGTQSCNEKVLKHVRDTKESLLWVVGAGNNGRENPDSISCLNTEVFPNVITVAGTGSDKRSLHNKSNYGMEHADIAADGNQSGDWGTSFATPRVAAMAAKLSNKYPQLSPNDLKLALLVSATPSSQLNQKVRSGGFLDW